MLSSEKIGGLRLLSWIWDMSPWVAAITVIAADFGLICVLMYLEGRAPWHRHQYKTFLYNDTIFIPIYVATTVVVMNQSRPFSGFFTTKTWHIGVLIMGFALSLLLEVRAVKSGQYNLSQELSPSKLWHTFIFGIMFYWGVSSLPSVFGASNSRHRILILIALVGWVTISVLDMILPQPQDAHLEGTYIPWEWHVRQK